MTCDSERNGRAIIKWHGKRIDALMQHTGAILESPDMTDEAKAEAVLMMGETFSRLLTPITACVEKCSHCCYQAVAITRYEADIIGKAINRAPEPLEGDPMEYVARDGHQTLYMGKPCPFLKDDNCSIYAARPMICRTHHSLEELPNNCKMGSGKMVGKLDILPLDAAMLGLPFKGIGDIREYFPSKDKA